MKKDLGVKTWLYPMPVLMIATYNEDGSPNAMNAAKTLDLVAGARKAKPVVVTF